MDYKKIHEHILQEHDLFLFEDDIKEIVRVVLEITDNELDIKDDYPLFEHIDKYYGVTLLESQMREIIDIVLEMHNEKPETCTSSIKKQYKEKGNQLDQVYGAIKEPSNNDQMKTAMQELIDKLNNVKPTQYCSIGTICGWAEFLLEKEKEQIVNAYNSGQQIPPFEFAEKYYNETYTNPDQV
jgi:hypothetical protein